jgi:hypothetical protein
MCQELRDRAAEKIAAYEADICRLQGAVRVAEADAEAKVAEAQRDATVREMVLLAAAQQAADDHTVRLAEVERERDGLVGSVARLEQVLPACSSSKPPPMLCTSAQVTG